MRRGTTATIQFTLPFTVDSITDGTITILQDIGDKTLTIKKEISECVLENDKITLKLSQEETLQMAKNIGLQIQLKTKTTNNDIIASRIYRVLVDDILDEVLL